MFQGPGDDYDRFIGRYGPALGDAMLDYAGVRSGMRVLDVGCGTGALAARAAAAVGGENVAAADPSEPFVETCRRRVPEADVRIAPAESLPFADDGFDAVLAQLVLPFLTDAPQGAAEMRRVAKPGGVVVACVWDYAAGMRLLRAFWDAAAAIDPASAACCATPTRTSSVRSGRARVWRTWRSPRWTSRRRTTTSTRCGRRSWPA